MTEVKKRSLKEEEEAIKSMPSEKPKYVSWEDWLRSIECAKTKKS
jgi:hypothetical protein